MSEVVAREILAEVLSSGLKPGDRLPAESVMLRQYDIARSTMREALRILEVYGVLAIRPGPGGGPVLADIGFRDIAHAMQLFFTATNLTLGEVTSSLHLLQAMLARQAATVRDPDQMERLRVAVERQPSEDRTEFHQTVVGFHHVLADVPGGKVLRVFVEAMEQMMALQVGMRVDIHDMKENLQDHEDIADAVFAGDPDLAAKLSAEHSKRVVKLLRKSAPGALERRIEWT